MIEITRWTRPDLVDLLSRLGLCSDMVPDALGVAEHVHGAQRRDGGGPYLEEHVYPVTATVATYLSRVDPAEGADTVLITILHDTIEDSLTVTERSLTTLFGGSIASGVVTLSKPSKHGGKSNGAAEEEEERYVDQIAHSAFPLRVVKVFDRLNNLAAVHHRPLEKRQVYLAETGAYYLDLARGVDESLAVQMTELLRAQHKRLDQQSAGSRHLS